MVFVKEIKSIHKILGSTILSILKIVMLWNIYPSKPINNKSWVASPPLSLLMMFLFILIRPSSPSICLLVLGRIRPWGLLSQGNRKGKLHSWIALLLHLSSILESGVHYFASYVHRVCTSANCHDIVSALLESAALLPTRQLYFKMHMWGLRALYPTCSAMFSL